MVERALISFPSQLQLIERLQHLIYLSSSMIFISGEKGSGKSTLIEQLSNQLPNKTQQAFVALSEPIVASQVRIQIISQLFSQPLFDADDTLSNSLLLLKDKLKDDMARVIVIDNASLLSEELLIELGEVIQSKASLTGNEINFIFLSDEVSCHEMMTTIKNTSHLANIAALPFKLCSLTEEESKQLFKLACTQQNYYPKMDHLDALSRQLAACVGVPEKILLLANNISNGNLEKPSSSWKNSRLPALLLMLLLVAVTGVLAYYLYPQLIPQQVEAETPIDVELLLVDEIPLQGLTAIEISNEETTEALAGKWSSKKAVIKNSELSVGEADSDVGRVVVDEKELHAVEREFHSPSQEQSASSTDLLAHEIIDVEVVKVLSEASATLALDEAIQVKVVSPVIVKPIVNETVTIVEPLIKVVTPTKPEVPKVIKELSKPSSLFTLPELLMSIDKKYYTLQLSGMSSEKSLQRFIKTHNLPQENVYVYETVRNNKPWYVVIYGQFKSLQQANLAAKKLPNSLKNLDSWAKKYASVHQELRLNE